MLVKIENMYIRLHRDYNINFVALLICYLNENENSSKNFSTYS